MLDSHQWALGLLLLAIGCRSSPKQPKAGCSLVFSLGENWFGQPSQGSKSAREKIFLLDNALLPTAEPFLVLLIASIQGNRRVGVAEASWVWTGGERPRLAEGMGTKPFRPKPWADRGSGWGKLWGLGYPNGSPSRRLLPHGGGPSGSWMAGLH